MPGPINEVMGRLLVSDGSVKFSKRSGLVREVEWVGFSVWSIPRRLCVQWNQSYRGDTAGEWAEPYLDGVLFDCRSCCDVVAPS